MSGRDGSRWRLWGLLAAALALRLALAAAVRGYPPDVTTFSAWADHAAQGLASFYSPGYFADYPPGYIYVLWVVGKLRLALGLAFDTPAFLVLLKLPSLLADLVAAGLLARLAGPRGGAAAVAALYAFNPAVLLDSAVWGQVDAVLTLFLLLGVALLPRRPGWAGAAFAAALLVKPQALIFAPIPLLWFADRLARERGRRTAADLLLFSGAALATFSLGVLPFAAGQGAGWVAGKYAGTLASYPYATLNAFNLFALTGANLAPVDARLLFLTYGEWGTLFLGGTVLFAAAVALRSRDPSRLWYLGLFLAASVFVLSAKMHERYLYPALAMALGLYAASGRRGALWLFAGFSATAFLNLGHVLVLGLREVFAVPRFHPLLLAVSAANVALWAVLVRLGWRLYVRRSQPASE